jgi:hypothetical protein
MVIQLNNTLTEGKKDSFIQILKPGTSALSWGQNLTAETSELSQPPLPSTTEKLRLADLMAPSPVGPATRGF